MRYFANAVILAAAIGLAQGLNCWVCEDAEGQRGACNSENEKDKECADLDQGCVEEVILDKESGESRTRRYCLEPSNPHNKSASFSLFAPMVTDRLKGQVNETITKGCMRWNTDKYQVGFYVCDKPNCNKDLDQGDCAHVCEERKASMKQPVLAQQLLGLFSSFAHHKVPSPKVAVKQQDYNTMPSKCWSCTREENGEIINTLCNEDNMVVADCAPGAVGCVESLMTFGPLKHDLRHCLVPQKTNVSIISPRDLIHIDAYDDEIYAKGCLKFYTPPSTEVDICICDEDECNKDCDCDYECDNVASTPLPPDTTTATSPSGAASVAATVSITMLASALLFA